MNPIQRSPLQQAENGHEPDTNRLYGHTEPRHFTPPLRELTPETSYGYDVIEFARDVLGTPLDPWQEWLVIHLGELLPDGRPRFRQALILVARQNGKTHLLSVLAAYWQAWEQWPIVLGTSTNLSMAKEAWDKAVNFAELTPQLQPLVSVRKANGQEELRYQNDDGSSSRYLIAASNRRGGRGLSIDRLILDELQEHHSWEAWSASVPATNARPYAQIVAISTQGPPDSEVLISLRESALKDLKQGTHELSREGIFEWSAPEDADISDPATWAYANPNLGYRVPYEAVSGPAMRALEFGGSEETLFRTEYLNMAVKAADGAVDARAWAKGYRPGELVDTLSPFTWGLDFDYNETEASLVAAQQTEEGTLLQVVKTWRKDELHLVASELEEKLKQYRPKQFGWFPGGPAAKLASSLKNLRIPGVTIRPLTGAEVYDATMGFSDAVNNGMVQYGIQDALLNDHVLGAQKVYNGDRWRFTRKTRGSVDAAYAAAGAWLLANTLPPPPDFEVFVV